MSSRMRKGRTHGRWQARGYRGWGYDRQRVHLGYFATQEEARAREEEVRAERRLEKEDRRRRGLPIGGGNQITVTRRPRRTPEARSHGLGGKYSVHTFMHYGEKKVS